MREAHLPAKSLVVHAGFANTDLQARSVRGSRRPQPALLPRPRASERHDAGARFALLLRAATDPKAEGGTLLAPRWVNGAPVRRPLFGRSRDREAMATLWEISEGETGIVFEVAPSS